MKIRKLFKKAAALALAAVTALSVMPAQVAFAAGDIGTISFTHTYDSNGNAMRYNSSAVINGYTSGGTGNYKYRMYVDGETAFCIQPGVPLKTGNTLAKASSDTWNALSSNQKKAVGLALLYGYQGNSGGLSGTDDEKWLATQTLVWEFVTGCREATGSYQQTSTTVYSLHFGSNYANSGARAAYDQIVSLLTAHNTIPSFMSGSKNGITKELSYSDGKYSITLTDTNGVLSDYSFTSSDSNVTVSKSGNKLTITSEKAVSGSVRITATRNNVSTVSSSAKMIAYGDPNLQDVVTGVENADTVAAYINIETPTGTVALKKISEDGVVEGIPHYTVEQTSDAFADPFIIRDNAVPEGRDGQYYDVGGIYQTFETEEEAQEYANTLNKAKQESEKEQPAELTAADFIGREITIDNRRYLIESVGEISGDVSLRDITFQNSVGFPINRVEKIGYIRRLLEQVQPELPPEKEKAGSPAPSALRRNYRITDDALGVGGAKEKFRNNMAAIRLLHELQIENRLATPEEQETLSKYVGWGGLSMAFDERNVAWANEYKELKAALSEEEYRAAMESTLTAFYTPPLSMVAAGEVNTIKKVGGKEETRRFLENLGFVVGGAVSVVSEINGSLIVNVKDSRVAIGKEMAAKILI